MLVRTPNNLHRIELPELCFVVDSNAGARLKTLDFGRGNVLTDKSVHSSNWGSTFWPSPQTAWGWPPPSFLDDAAWSLVEAGDDFLVFESPCADVGETAVVITKRFAASHASTACFRTSYAMRCQRDERAPQARLASWEISRVPGGGTSFFLRGEFELSQIGPHAPLRGKTVGDCLVFEHAQLFHGESAKIHAHTNGCFLGHFSADAERLLLELFEPVAAKDVAAGEGNVELFYNECGGYIELEVQGPAVAMREGAVARLGVHRVELDVPPTLGPLQARIEWGRAQALALAGELSLSTTHA